VGAPPLDRHLSAAHHEPRAVFVSVP
jgi:hypothetical protein